MESKKSDQQFQEEIEQLRARIYELEKSKTVCDQSEMKILEYNKRYFALFMNNPVQTIVVDKDCKIIAFNEAQRRCGYRLPEIGSLMYVDYAGKHNIDMHSELLNCMKLNEVKNFPELKYADGETFLCITIAPYEEGAIITSEDITKRILTENELIEYRNYLEELVKERTLELQEKNRELDNAIRVFAGREMTIRDMRKIIRKLEGNE